MCELADKAYCGWKNRGGVKITGEARCCAVFWCTSCSLGMVAKVAEWFRSVVTEIVGWRGIWRVLADLEARPNNIQSPCSLRSSLGWSLTLDSVRCGNPCSSLIEITFGDADDVGGLGCRICAYWSRPRGVEPRGARWGGSSAACDWTMTAEIED